VIEFDRKRVGLRPISSTDVTDEIIEHPGDHVVSHLTCVSPELVLHRESQTQAMIISTQHLLPSPAVATDQAQAPTVGPSQGGMYTGISAIPDA
jgi:actin-related protein 8